MSKRTFGRYLGKEPSSLTDYIDELKYLLSVPELAPGLVDTTLRTSPPENGTQFDGSKILGNFEQTQGNMLDNDNQELTVEALEEINNEYTDISEYMHHPFFLYFFNVWRLLRKAKMWAQHQKNRAGVQEYLCQLRASINPVLQTTAALIRNDENPMSRRTSILMFSALRKLDSGIVKTSRVFTTFENSKKDPVEVIELLMESSLKIQNDVSQALDPNCKLDATGEQNGFLSFYDNVFSKLSQDEISKAIFDTFDIKPPHALDSSSTQIKPSSIKGSKQESEPLQSNTKQNKYIWIQETIPKYTNQTDTQKSRSNQPATHGKPSPKPPIITNPPYDNQINVQYITPRMILSGNINTVFLQSTSQRKSEELDFLPMDKFLCFDEDKQDHNPKNKLDDDDEYIQENNEHNDIWSDEPPRKKQKSLFGKGEKIKQASKPRLKNSATSENDKKERKITKARITRRTATSYDATTTQYLMKFFFEVYSVRDKLTKAERRKIHKDTQISYRNITYWFSNRKRRFAKELEEYRRLVSNGSIKCHEDYLEWKEAHDK